MGFAFGAFVKQHIYCNRSKGDRKVNITKIKIKNLFGISEYEADGKSVELSGKNGAGKTSVIDAIRYALTNKSDRKYIVRNGESTGRPEQRRLIISL